MKKECKMMSVCPVTWVAMLLVTIGAVNWGLVGAFDWNLVSALVGQWEGVENVVYILVGLAGIWMLVKCLGCCGKCKK